MKVEVRDKEGKEIRIDIDLSKIKRRKHKYIIFQSELKWYIRSLGFELIRILG